MEDKSFKSYEKKERVLAKQYFEYSNITEYTFEPDGNYATTDGDYVIDGKKVRFEIKVRNFEKDRFPTLILELKKAAQLLQYHKQGYKATYLNFFKEADGTHTAIEFDLSTRFKYWQHKGYKNLRDVSITKSLPSYTAGSGGYFIDKEVIMLTPQPKVDIITTFS